jgi:hypothetical protein
VFCRTSDLRKKYKGELNIYKVGYTTISVKERLKKWELDSGEKYSSLIEIETKFPIYFEYWAHELFKNNRVVYRDQNDKIDRIEWFLVKFEKL